MGKNRYVGVSRAESGRWQGVVTVDRRQHSVGSWATRREAALARDRAVLWFKVDRPLNFPKEARKAGAMSPEKLRDTARRLGLREVGGVRRAASAATTRARRNRDYVGVYEQPSGRFLALTCSVSAGTWATAEEAALARDRLLIYMGRRGTLNFPDRAKKAGAASALALRAASLSRNPVRGKRVRLTDAQVRALRRKADKGASFQQLATEYGVSLSNLGRMVRGETRAGAGGPLQGARKPLLTDAQIRAVRRAFAKGEGVMSIAERFGISHAHVSNLAHGYARPDAGGPISERRR